MVNKQGWQFNCSSENCACDQGGVEEGNAEEMVERRSNVLGVFVANYTFT